jgi:mono/diheme cytochrome c family protein
MVRGIFLAALVALLLPGAPRADPGMPFAASGQPHAGYATAQRLCADCHAVAPGERRLRKTVGPTFETVAAVPGMTSAALRVTLTTSHRTMPNLMLSSDELRDIGDYILSLKPGR